MDPAATTETPVSPAPSTGSADGGEAVDLSDEGIAKLAAGLVDDAPPAEGEKPATEDKVEGDEKPPAEAEKPAPEQAAMPEAIRLRKLGARLARRDESLRQREQALQGKVQLADKLATLSRTDKLAALRELGINEDEIVDAVLARKTVADSKPLTPEERIAKLEAERETDRAALAQAQAAQRAQSQYVAFRGDQVAKITAAPGLPRVKASQQLQDDVIQNMGAYHARWGVLPDPVETARYVEAADRVREELEKEDSSDRRTVKTPPSTSRTKNTAAPSPSLTDRISDTPVGDDDLPDDPDERLAIAWQRLNS